MDAHADTMAHCPVTPSILRRRGSRSRRCGTDGSSNSSSSGGNRNNSRSSSSIYVLVLVGLLHLARGSTDIGPAQTPLGPTPRPPLCDAAILPPGRVVPVHDAEALAAGKQQRSTTPCRRTAAAASAAFALPDDLPRLPKIRPIERPGFLVRHTARRGGGGEVGKSISWGCEIAGCWKRGGREKLLWGRFMLHTWYHKVHILQVAQGLLAPEDSFSFVLDRVHDMRFSH